MNLQYFTLPIFLILSTGRAESLQCLSCSGTLDAKECNQTVTCSNDQVCYKKREFTDQVRFELGCVNKQSCGRYATLPSTTASIKMNGGHSQYCYECCSTPNCNKDLCEQPHQSKCDDSESVDCALLNSMFSICEIIEQAKKICPNYCGLCHVAQTSWANWLQWGTCSATCGVGMQSRNRTCTSQGRDGIDSNCVGNDLEYRLCYPGRHCLSDCYEIRKLDSKSMSGVYMVSLWKSKQTVQVYCDMDTTEGGWTVFQYRFNGTVDFYKNFSEYETGFGNLESEFWLGLQTVQEMASQFKTELRIDLTAANGTTVYETFQNFYLDSRPYYNLHIDLGQGTAGDSKGLSYSKGAAFTTVDNDLDNHAQNCAVLYHGGWWFKHCAFANLNGEYITPGTTRPHGQPEGGVTYRSFQVYKSLKATKMMFRRVE